MNELSCDFDVAVEIAEDDGKGGFTAVPLDKDCFKLRQNTKKKISLTVSQPSTARPLVVERWVYSTGLVYIMNSLKSRQSFNLVVCPEILWQETIKFSCTVRVNVSCHRHNTCTSKPSSLHVWNSLPKINVKCAGTLAGKHRYNVSAISHPLSSQFYMYCRCFGLLISPGKDVKNSEMNLLDNMVSLLD